MQTKPSISAPAGSATRAPDRQTPPVIRYVVGPLTKVLNPLVLSFAGRRYPRMVARLTHYGRRSGKPYVTPVGARRIGEQIWIPLTFGAGSDWCRNVLATGACDIRLHGRSYRLQSPSLVEAADMPVSVRKSFPLTQRAVFRLLGITAYMRLSMVAPAA